LYENELHLLHHFNGSLAQLLSFGSHGSQNAFGIHLLPLVESSSVVLGAVETISTAHLHMLGSIPLAEAGDMHSKSLRLLSRHLSSPSQDHASMEAALTAVLMMVYYEVILSQTKTSKLI
jgi:hypothetical protein